MCTLVTLKQEQQQEVDSRSGKKETLVPEKPLQAFLAHTSMGTHWLFLSPAFRAPGDMDCYGTYIYALQGRDGAM